LPVFFVNSLNLKFVPGELFTQKKAQSRIIIFLIFIVLLCGLASRRGFIFLPTSRKGVLTTYQLLLNAIQGI